MIFFRIKKNIQLRQKFFLGNFISIFIYCLFEIIYNRFSVTSIEVSRILRNAFCDTTLCNRH